MPTLHTIYRSGVISHVGIPRFYNIVGLLHCENGGRQKTYSISSAAKKKISSSLTKMWYERRNNLTFLTFTFKNNDELAHIVQNQKVMNTFFCAFLDNFKKTYKLHSYIWVSERTKNNGIHYHVVCDFPKLKRDRYEQFTNYFKDYFCDFLLCNNINIDRSIQYCSIGLPSKRDSSGNYRGSVVRSIEAIQAYVSGYLKKSDRVETAGRIYAISRNVLEKPVKCESFQRSEVGAQLVATYEHEYCTVDYYNLNGGAFDSYFLRKKKQKRYVVQSDISRNLDVKMQVNKRKSIVQFANNAINNSNEPKIIEPFEKWTIKQHIEYSEAFKKYDNLTEKIFFAKHLT
jgi:hypothetical protein